VAGQEDPRQALRQKVVKALQKSGYPLELRVAAKLRQSDHEYVQHTRHYVDTSTGKIRETDIVACWRATRGLDSSFVYLVIECKNKPFPWVVFEPDDSTADLRELASSLFAQEFYEPPRLWKIISGTSFAVDRSFLEPLRVGRSVVEVKIARDDAVLGVPERQKDGGPDGAYSAVQAAVSAVEGFWQDVDAPALRKLGKTSAVAMPTVVTSGALFRGRLGETGEIEVEETDFTQVYVRPNAQAVARRCAVVTEAGLSRLMRQASRTAALLLPPQGFKDSPPDPGAEIGLNLDPGPTG
jgi:hypothetical protein